MNQTDQNEIGSDGSDVSGELMLSVIVMEPPPDDPREPAMMVKTYLAVESVLPSALEVDAVYSVPDLTGWLPGSVRQVGRPGNWGRPAVAGSLRIHRARVRPYRIASVAASMYAAQDWLRRNHPERSSCVLTLGQYPDISAELPREIGQNALVGELSIPGQTEECVYAVMIPISAKWPVGYVIRRPRPAPRARPEIHPAA